MGGLGEEREERDELVEEMDTKIRELTEAVTSKDRELERLKETVRMLQEKVASSPRGEISAAKEGLRSFHVSRSQRRPLLGHPLAESTY